MEIEGEWSQSMQEEMENDKAMEQFFYEKFKALFRNIFGEGEARDFRGKKMGDVFETWFEQNKPK